MRLLIPGARFSGIYNSIKEFIRKRKPHLVDKLTHSLGFSIGIIFTKSYLTIKAGSTVTAMTGMVIHVYVGFLNLINSASQSDDPESKEYALKLGDTVVVNEVNF